MRYVVVVLALLAVAFFAYAQSDTLGGRLAARYQIAVAWNSQYHAFKIDTVTGVVSFCAVVLDHPGGTVLGVRCASEK